MRESVKYITLITYVISRSSVHHDKSVARLS